MIAENSYGEVSNLNSTQLTAPRMSGLNQKTRLEECYAVQSNCINI